MSWLGVKQARRGVTQVEVLLLLVLLLVLAVAAVVAGAESRDGADWVRHPRP
jgi:hypothetical protein